MDIWLVVEAQRVTFGHGEFGDRITLRVPTAGGYPTGEPPVAFLSKEAADNFIAQQSWKAGLSAMSLAVQD